LTGADSDPVRPALVALCKRPDLGPVGVVARPSRAELDRARIDAVKHIDDLDMRELREPSERILGQLRAIALDARDHRSPVIVDRLGSWRADEPDRLHRERYGKWWRSGLGSAGSPGVSGSGWCAASATSTAGSAVPHQGRRK